jgi:bifunctional ADP-heptose synthase (sugar kinase/adenylyltransferase)
MWEPKEGTLQKKFQSVVTVCKDFGLNVSVDKCDYENNPEYRGMEKIKCNNHEIKEVESFKYFGSKICCDEWKC